MALKNLFDMVKADRYTADGREAIIKAQEEETEDARRTYQIGEISEATGLQKTAQGWKPPKETKFGKVKQNKEGQWGVQTKQGKGSDFLKHKSEKEASRALANYTAGYNTTERSKQDPHSDQARQVKHWDKETDKIRKQNRAEGRAAHAAQFQKPAPQEEIGKFYTKFEDVQSAYDAGRQTFPEGGYTIFETPQGYKVVDDPKISQRMEAAGYRKEAEVPEGTKPPKGPGENIGVNEKENKIRQVLNTALTPSGDKVQMTKSKVTGDFHVLLNGKSTGGGFRDPQKAKEEFNAWIAGKKAPSESAKERINKRFDESEARSQKAMETAEKPERFDYRSSLEKNPRDAFSFKGTVTHSIPTNQYHYDELQNLASFMREEKATYQNALKSRAQALVDGHRSNGDWEPKKEQALMDIAKAVDFDEELHKFIEEENRGYDLGYSEDSAPTLSEIVDRVYNIGEISEKTGLQKTANGWRPVKKGAAGKTSRASKEEAIRKDLGLTEGEDMSRFSDEQIEKMYAKTQQTPEQQKADFDKSKIGQAMNKGRQEFAAEKTRQKELASKTNAIGLPKESNLSDIPDFKGMESGDYDKKLRAEGWTTGGWEGSGTHASAIFKKGDRTIRVNEGQPGKITSVQEISKPAAAPKLNQVEKVDGANRPYRIKGTQFYFDTPEEAETAIVAGTRGEGKTYAKPSSDATINEIQNALGFKLDSEYAGKYSMDDFMKKTGKDEYGVKVWSFGTDSKGTLIDTIVEGYNKPNATIKKENGEWRLHYTDRDGKKMIVTPKGREWPTSDSAPRQLTGDCRIRIRKEKPALTGDTKIRVRK